MILEFEEYKLFGSFGDFVRYIRKMNNVTMKELSNVSGVSQPYLSLVENNKNNPSDEVIRGISHGISELSPEVNEEELSNQLAEAQNYFTEKALRNAIASYNSTAGIKSEVEKAKDTVNLDLVMKYFDVEKQIEENFLKRESGEKIHINDRFHNYTILLDEKELTPKEINMLQAMLLGIREKRKESE